MIRLLCRGPVQPHRRRRHPARVEGPSPGGEGPGPGPSPHRAGVLALCGPQRGRRELETERGRTRMIPASTRTPGGQATEQSEPVMVGVDGSWRQTGAVEWALDEALRTGAPLQVLHVVDAGQTVDAAAQDVVAAVGERAEKAIPGRVTA